MTLADIETTKNAMVLLVGLPVAIRFEGDRGESLGILEDVGARGFTWRGRKVYLADVAAVRAVPTSEWDELQDAGRLACLEDA